MCMKQIFVEMKNGRMYGAGDGKWKESNLIIFVKSQSLVSGVQNKICLIDADPSHLMIRLQMILFKIDSFELARKYLLQYIFYCELAENSESQKIKK